LKENEGDVELGLIDCSLSERTDEIEKMGVDLRLFFEVFNSTHSSISNLESELWSAYMEGNPQGDKVKKKLDEITRRGRYLSENWGK
jgi:tRNA A-37 threonylcarbamoyl transferase component Bud32